ncbi:kinase-like domain-containing protein [Rhizophagus irregularis DAOM 181602=DAOM 197198]|uniref:Cmk1p n=2 Tax=Rhizophagus irregularis TaxID=588596 RepID=A0A015N543_RHIIW|nr:kinase-like domain-containing protein [Rhizophagus irregularis DAOM 181602=DAOM 197198]EXX74238.1 Cmk1p [Rhizophagus irregularis DAOM 197198w]POG63150.1 kinase-like domain-containing protein [Rhizophagus irregularis DAOM 181602=DAOM 197198]|eukprot:XP_025170016.1 kinase-like domain-containing protein [Rhizophagus irregularis DAOM 181602=DAOM 197198]
MGIMDYANKGNLRGNLTKIIKYNWKQKLYILYQIISGINEIHKQNIIHCCLQDFIIFIHKDKEDEDRIYISDFELCQPVKSFLKKDEIFGLTPFMAPEVLRSKPFTQASDIYSFSMIMWEFTSGVPPFVGREYDFQLSISICKGERPEIVENTPQCYIDLMKKCWNEDQLKRPSSKEVLNIIEEWIILPDKTKAEDIDEELKCNIMEFINVPIGYNNLAIESHRLLNITLNENS